MESSQLATLDRKRREDVTFGPDSSPDRTLLYGYDVDRSTWHVYQRDGLIHVIVYTGGLDTGDLVATIRESAAALPATKLVPNKRLYPDACDFAFCDRLVEAGVHLPFTNFRAERAPANGDFVGLVLEDIPEEQMKSAPTA